MKDKKYLVVSEVSKKQAYIFKTNKLKENIGASVIIEYITEDLTTAYLQLNNGEPVYEGGGSSLFIFDDKENMKNFIKGTTTHVLDKFPGVEFFMAYKEFDDNTEDIRSVIDEVYKELNKKKNKRESVFKRHSYGIEEKCNRTSYPAVVKSDDSEEYLSRESQIKRKKNNKKQTTIERILSRYDGYKFPLELEELGIKKGENSNIAIVSLDGNKMGKKLETFKANFTKNNEKLQKISNAEFNKAYLKELKQFSDDIKNSYEASFDNMIKEVINNYDKLKLDKSFKLENNTIPIRPIILAGDDVCFICNAKIALECVERFIIFLNEQDFKEGTLHACAGICIVKASYPFEKAYDIAESLCKSSKAQIKEDEDASLIDWHISRGEISQSLKEIRENIKIDKSINLNIKPLYVNKEYKHPYKSYNNFKSELLRLKEDKKSSNTKLRTLRDILPQGKDQTQLFINKYQMKDIFKDGFKISDAYCFNNNDCLYFDILEILDDFKNLD